MNQTDYQSFLTDVKKLIQQAQYRALKTVNHELVTLYWDLGHLIVTKQETYSWGKSIVEQLAKDLQMTFPGSNGFSAANLWRCRNFYLAYKDSSNLAAMLREIGWTHNIIIFEKCKDDLEREFYMLHVRKFGWTSRVLQHQIENKTYQKYLLNQTNFDEVLPNDYKHQALLAIKDHYTFDFLELTSEHSERELEAALVQNIRAFLMEMGNEFAFIGSQYRLVIEDDEFFIDLLLFHRRLQCLVAIDLKIGAFKAEYKGKMELYLTALNHQIKMPHEQDAIGIIICKTKNHTVVEYSLSNASHPIGVATYSLSNTLPEQYIGLLPSPEFIAEKLSHIKNLFKE
jgi:predicted nuclease of restriction endonuclease-like (RecB) superfamily